MNSIITKITVAFLGVVLVMAGLSFAMSNVVTKPILELTNAIRRMGKQGGGVRVEVHLSLIHIFADAKDVLHTEEQLMQNIPKEEWSIAHHWLIFHGRRCCSARNLKCEGCSVREYCMENLKNQKKQKQEGK